MWLGALVRDVDAGVPKWLKSGLEDRYRRFLPSDSVLELVCLRAPVYLVSSRTMDMICPPRPVCYNPELAEEAERALDRIFSTIAGILRGEREAELDYLFRRFMPLIDEVADSVASRAKPAECTVLQSVACYRRVTGSQAFSGVKAGPAIFVCLDRLEEIASEIERDAPREAVQDEDERGRFRFGLFRGVVAHEMVHSLCDASLGDSPSARFAGTFFGRVIEESLATYYFFVHSDVYSPMEKVLRHWLLYKQPLEYRVFWFWERLDSRLTDKTLLSWAGLPSILCRLPKFPERIDLLPLNYVLYLIRHDMPKFWQHFHIFLERVVTQGLLKFLPRWLLMAEVERRDAPWKFLALHIAASCLKP